MTVNASVRLDWVSFTINDLDLTSQQTRVNSVLQVLNQAHFELGYEFMFDGDDVLLSPHSHHKPYAWGFSHPEIKGLVIMGSMGRSEILVDLQGQFCAEFPDVALSFAKYFRDRLTRVDVACDVVTSITPKMAVRGHKSKTVSDNQSLTGDTIYLGSSKSEIMARVYRYAPPHPRADLLRSEIVYRRDTARAMVYQLCGGVSLEQVVRGYWDRLNLQEFRSLAIFENEGVGVKIVQSREVGDKTMDKRRRWLLTQVNPAIAAMIASGFTTEDIIACLPALGMINTHAVKRA